MAEEQLCRRCGYPVSEGAHGYGQCPAGAYGAELESPPVERRPAVASCLVCGGKYRPAGGECIHEHPAPEHEAFVGMIRRAREQGQSYVAAIIDGGYVWRCERQDSAPELYEGI